MREITDKEIIKIIDVWFKNDKEIFTDEPLEYDITIERDNIMINAVFENGDTDYAGLGNKYKFLWERGL